MQYERNSDCSLAFNHLDPFLAEMLRLIPTSGDPTGSVEATGRLFPDPAGQDAVEPELLRDWSDFVRPELEKLFRSAHEIVLSDLEKMERVGDGEISGYRLHIPTDHFFPWLSALNQARLVLVERNGLTEEEMERVESFTLETRRDLCIFQVGFYGLLQEFILEGMEEG